MISGTPLAEASFGAESGNKLSHSKSVKCRMRCWRAGSQSSGKKARTTGLPLRSASDVLSEIRKFGACEPTDGGSDEMAQPMLINTPRCIRRDEPKGGRAN